ncbi:CidA/LrgA family protein [Nocardioides montaniterrae]
MIAGLAWLVGFQLAGSFISESLDLPVPGQVIGMLLCFGWLRLRRTPDDAAIVRTSTALLGHLQLLFVPAGVGVVVYVRTIGDHALPIALAMAVSWFLGLVVVGWTAVLLERLLGKTPDDLPAGAHGDLQTGEAS